MWVAEFPLTAVCNADTAPWLGDRIEEKVQKAEQLGDVWVDVNDADTHSFWSPFTSQPIPGEALGCFA